MYGTDTQPSTAIKVLLVDDEDIVRYGLRAILQAEAALDVVGEACNGKDAIAQTQRLQPDVVLMDISMPVMDGISATQAICQQQPSPKVLILTTHDESAQLTAAMQQGAAGYLLKNTPPEDFLPLIQSTHKGYMQLSPGLTLPLGQPQKTLTTQSLAATDKGVTPREQEVLKLIAEGASNREISQILHITEKTVKNHVSNILRRVGLRDRTQLAIWETQMQITA